MVRNVGIIGAGQLGRMLGMAAPALDARCTFLDPSPGAPAAIAGRVIEQAFDDANALQTLAMAAEVITYEFENVPVAALEALAGIVPVLPPTAALFHAQDRAREKELFAALDIPLPAWRLIDTRDDLHAAAESIGLPLILKTRRFGYDGKGQASVDDAGDIERLMAASDSQPLIAEARVAFDFEVSAIGVRGREGERAFYSLTRNEHRDGMLRTSRAPAGDLRLERLARDYLTRIMSHLDYVGVLALELFVVGEQLFANEFAPRVHNSGHWTIEGTASSQFENHLRAILGLPLGDTAAQGHAGMVNLIGAMPADPDALLEKGLYLHDYGKQARPGRKLGHVTLLEDTAEGRDARLARIDAMLRH